MLNKCLVSFFVVIFCCGIFLMGCGTSNSNNNSALPTASTHVSPTATPATTTSALVNTAKSVSVIGNGIAYTGSTLTSMFGGGSSHTSINSKLVRSKAAGGIPASFFTINIRTGAASVDGYIPLTTSSVVGGNMVPYVRLGTVNGQLLAGDTLNGIKLASFEGIAWKPLLDNEISQEVFQAAVEKWCAAYTLEANPYTSSALFVQQINTAGEYVVWCSMIPTMSPPNGVHFATPEALAGDKLSSLEARMVFSNTATGEIVLDLPTSSEGGGSPLLGTYSASGNLQTARGTLDATVSLTLIGSTAGPTISDIHITGRTTPEGYRISCHTNVLGAGTGVISNEAGALIATMETTSLGGIIYPVGGTAESFSF